MLTTCLYVETQNVKMHVQIFPFSDCSGAYTSTQLVKENSEIVLTCPFRVESKYIIWLGPKEEKLTTYIVGKLINPNISSYSRIHLVGNHSNGEYNLQILNVSSNDVGTYQCQSVQNGTAVQRTFLLKISGNHFIISNISCIMFYCKHYDLYQI